MNPQLQTAFDIMYAKAEQFIPAHLRADYTDSIRKGDTTIAVQEALAWLLNVKVTPSNAQAHRSAVAAFGEFWHVFTALSYGTTPSARICAICGQKKGGN